MESKQKKTKKLKFKVTLSDGLYQSQVIKNDYNGGISSAVESIKSALMSLGFSEAIIIGEFLSYSKRYDELMKNANDQVADELGKVFEVSND